MSNSGKQLQELVEFVESRLVPQGFTVQTNERVFSDSGVQIAEFDVIVQGKVGSTDIKWLIECRDRPSDGPQGVSWVEQLVGRRSRFHFSKVTAVSTTGFSSGAKEFALNEAIELRKVDSLTPDAFSDWLQFSEMVNIKRNSTLIEAGFLLDREPTKTENDAMNAFLSTVGEKPFLRSVVTGEVILPDRALRDFLMTKPELWEDVEAGGAGKVFEGIVHYNNQDHFVIDMPEVSIEVTKIKFKALLTASEHLSPIDYSRQYEDVQTGESISQVVGFKPVTVMSKKYVVELQRLAMTGETHVNLRIIDDEE